MSIEIFSLDDKIAVLDVEIQEARSGRRAPGTALYRHYEVLKAIAADVRARQALPRNSTLGAIERELVRLRQTRTVDGFDVGRMTELSNMVNSRWPVISQALERYGEESAE